jgi:hypothetical protein
MKFFLFILAHCLCFASASNAQPASKAPPATADFFTNPTLACAWYAEIGLLARQRWSQMGGADKPYQCYYATEFSRDGPSFMRGAAAAVDAKTKMVTLTLIVQTFPKRATQADAFAALAEFAQVVMQTQGKTLTAEALNAIRGQPKAKVRVGEISVEPDEDDDWASTYSVRVSLVTPATKELLATIERGPSANERTAKNAMEQKLANRCVKAIETAEFEDKPSTPIASYTRTSKQIAESFYIFVYGDNKGNNYNCRVCDDFDENITCDLSMGARIQYNKADGTYNTVPSELDLRCVSRLQKGLKRSDDGKILDRSIVNQITTTAAHTEKSYVYLMNLPGHVPYRCVLKKSDLMMTIQHQVNGKWID